MSLHYDNVIMTAMASQITSLTIVYSTVYSGAYQRKHQSSASLAFVRGIHRGPVNSPHKWPVTRKMFPFDDVIMGWLVASEWYRYMKYTHTSRDVHYRSQLLALCLKHITAKQDLFIRVPNQSWYSHSQLITGEWRACQIVGVFWPFLCGAGAI